jgi:hypothetical protein
LLRCSSKLSRSRACCCNATSSHAPEPDKLRSLLLQRNKLQSRTSSEVCCVATASSHTLELAVATQQALMLWSLLRCSKQAPEPDKLQSLLRCSSKLSRSGTGQAPELGALQGLIAVNKLRSREAPEKLRSLELACLFKQNKQK